MEENTYYTRKEIGILLTLVLIAMLTRLLVLVVGRPEFVGWFNHTYYYYTQTRHLLNTGELAFSDMPLLFYLYAGTASIFKWFGLAEGVAIVNSSRL